MSTLPTTQNTQRPVARGYGALITYGSAEGDDLYVMLAPTPDQPTRRTTGQSGAQMLQVESNPEDFRPESGRIFSRSRFTGGEGLDYAHRAGGNSELDATRFWNSRNISVSGVDPGEQDHVTLLPETAAIADTGATTPIMVRPANTTTVFWVDDTAVKNSTNLATASPTINTETPVGGTTVSGLCALGRTLYGALGAHGIHIRTWAGSWQHWSDLAATAVWSAKGRVLASTGASLYDAAALAASTLLKTLDSNESWTDVIDAGGVILAAATDGKVYAFADEATALVLRGETEMPLGEVPYCLAYSHGLVLVGVGDVTTSGKIGRVYVSQLTGNRLRNSQMLRQWGSDNAARDYSPRTFLVTRDAVYWGIIEDGSETHLWKYHLTTAGLTRDLIVSASNLVRGIVQVNDHLIVGLDTSGLYREADTFASSGYLITPLADFYSAADKAWVGVRLDNLTLTAAGAQVTLAYSTNAAAILDSAHTSWTTAITVTPTNGRVTTEQPLSDVTGRYIALKVALTRSTAQTASPEVTTMAARQFEQAEDVVLELPINVDDMVERSHRMALRVPGRGKAVLDKLYTLEGKPVHVHLLRSGVRVRGRLEEVASPSPYRARRGSSETLVAMVRVRGAKVTV